MTLHSVTPTLWVITKEVGIHRADWINQATVSQHFSCSRLLIRPDLSVYDVLHLVRFEKALKKESFVLLRD